MNQNAIEKVTRRGQIIGMRQAGKSVTEISHELGISRSTVYLWIQRWEAEGNIVDKNRPGASRKTNQATDAAILDEAKNNPITNAVHIRDVLQLEISARTVRRRLHENGIHHRTPACKEILTEDHRQRRLNFARQYVDQDLDFWKKVIFTDEKTFASTDHGKMHCWRENNTRYNRANIFSDGRSGHVTANIWGWMSGFGVGEVTKIEGRFNSDSYIEILEEVLLPSVRAMILPHPEVITLMHDRCPIHTARRVTRFLEEQPYVEVLDWPSRSCDLNPIENLWGIMVNEWEMRRERTSAELYRHVVEVWEGVRNRPAIPENLATSMPNRLQQVIEKEGGWIKY